MEDSETGPTRKTVGGFEYRVDRLVKPLRRAQEARDQECRVLEQRIGAWLASPGRQRKLALTKDEASLVRDVLAEHPRLREWARELSDRGARDSRLTVEASEIEALREILVPEVLVAVATRAVEKLRESLHTSADDRAARVDLERQVSRLVDAIATGDETVPELVARLREVRARRDALRQRIARASSR